MLTLAGTLEAHVPSSRRPITTQHMTRVREREFFRNDCAYGSQYVTITTQRFCHNMSQLQLHVPVEHLASAPKNRIFTNFCAPQLGPHKSAPVRKVPAAMGQTRPKMLQLSVRLTVTHGLQQIQNAQGNHLDQCCLFSNNSLLLPAAWSLPVRNMNENTKEFAILRSKCEPARQESPPFSPP